MKRHLLFTAIPVLLAMSPPARAETHQQVQAVNSSGTATYFKVLPGAPITPANRIVLEGIVLNNPEQMLDATYNAAGFMGAQWQIFVQGEGGDHAGTTIWMGQRYGRMGDVDYTAQEWAAEMQRVNTPSGHTLGAGDRIRVTGYGMDRNGKVNINERHSTSSMMDFSIEYLGTSPGLPGPEVITLADVRDGTNLDIFDATRATGGEYYQGRLVRINNVHYFSGAWAANQTITITDGTGRTFPVQLGTSAAFNQPCNLGTMFDVVGIFNQENSATSGYRLWVMGYNGSSNLLGIAPAMAGDIDANGLVNAADLQMLVAAWNTIPGDLRWNLAADLIPDSRINIGDLQVLVASWGL